MKVRRMWGGGEGGIPVRQAVTSPFSPPLPPVFPALCPDAAQYPPRRRGDDGLFTASVVHGSGCCTAGVRVNSGDEGASVGTCSRGTKSQARWAPCGVTFVQESRFVVACAPS